MLDQEKIPYTITSSIKGNWDLIILPVDHALPIKDMLNFVKSGGAIFASYDDDSNNGLAITDKINTFQPFGNGVIYYHDYPLGEEIIKTEFYARSAKRNIYSQLISHSNHNVIHNEKRGIRMNFKHILYKLVGPLTQIWYWPNSYQACFCQRIDVDFPLKMAFDKKRIIQKMVDLINVYGDINFSLFLNHTFTNQNIRIKNILKNTKNIEFQSHGCTKRIKHRDYCYSLDNLSDSELTDMLRQSVINEKTKIFAPPCEHVNERVLETCENLGIKFISAGGMAKDDIPGHCFFYGKKYHIMNIPTSEKEFAPTGFYTNEFYQDGFDEAIQDNSLFCIYFHPYILLQKKQKEILTTFFDYILAEKSKKNIWFPFMSELAIWWYNRDRVDIKDGAISYRDNDTKTFFSQNKNLKLSIIKWSPGKITRLA